jgi:hypothetical protein
MLQGQQIGVGVLADVMRDFPAEPTVCVTRAAVASALRFPDPPEFCWAPPVPSPRTSPVRVSPSFALTASPVLLLIRCYSAPD